MTNSDDEESQSSEEQAESADDASYDPKSFSLDEQQYGLQWLMRFREVMLPIAKPPAVAHLKFLICPGTGYDGSADREAERERSKSDRKGKKSKDKNSSKGGRFIPEMGKTEVLAGSQRGTWWRNRGLDGLDVIVREQFILSSPELFKVPPGHYVLQGGPVEIFVSGPASGLTRMPVMPRGWVTVDASSVGGPLYLEKVKAARWKVVFCSGSSKGDIVVRGGVSLDTEEVAVLTCGTIVEQRGPSEVTEEGIVRMPISFGEGIGREPSSSSAPPRTRSGWVTCDARAQGGPVFFEPVPPEETKEPPRRSAPSSSYPVADGGHETQDVDASRHSSWDANRFWKVINMEATFGKQSLPLVSRPEAYAPGAVRRPGADIFVRYLQDGDLLEQTGHSKRVRGYMVMPVKITSFASGEPPVEGEFWVCRRSVEKTPVAWFAEITDKSDQATRKKPRRPRGQGHREEE